MTDYEPFQILPTFFHRRNSVERTLSNVNGKPRLSLHVAGLQPGSELFEWYEWRAI